MNKITTLLILFMVFQIKAQTNIQLSLSKYNTIYQPSNLSNGAGDFLFAGATSQASGQNLRRALLQFDLSSIPSGATITSVTLNLDMNRTNSGATNINLHKVSQDWGQGTSNAGGQEGGGAASTTNDASWNCSFNNGAGGCTSSWTAAGADFTAGASTTTSVAGIGAYTWSSATMVADVQSWLNNSAINFGWILIGDESVTNTSKRFSAISTNPPTLDITYDNTLGIENVNSFGINLYPNPSSDFIQFTGISNTESYKVYNILGAKIIEGTINKDNQIDIKNLAKGIYYIHLESGASMKFIKQ